MGYTTTFMGSVSVEPALNAAEQDFLHDLAETRRMDRVKGPLYVGGESGATGQGPSADIHDYNRHHPDQPGLWLQWVSADDGASIEWDDNEKFYNAEEWMRYLIDNLFSPEARDYVNRNHTGDKRLDLFTFNHVFNGSIIAQGENTDDRWKLIVKDNVVTSVALE